MRLLYVKKLKSFDVRTFLPVRGDIGIRDHAKTVADITDIHIVIA